MAQVGVAFVLLGAGLVLASFHQLLHVDPGFDVKGVVTPSTSVPQSLYPKDADASELMDRALAAIRAIPGVTAAGATTTIPWGGNHSDNVILAEGYSMRPGESLISPEQVTVTPGYFEAMHIAIVAGACSMRAIANPPPEPSSWTSGWRTTSGRLATRSAGACICRRTSTIS